MCMNIFLAELPEDSMDKIKDAITLGKEEIEKIWKELEGRTLFPKSDVGLTDKDGNLDIWPIEIIVTSSTH